MLRTPTRKTAIARGNTNFSRKWAGLNRAKWCEKSKYEKKKWSTYIVSDWKITVIDSVCWQSFPSKLIVTLFSCYFSNIVEYMSLIFYKNQCAIILYIGSAFIAPSNIFHVFKKISLFRYLFFLVSSSFGIYAFMLSSHFIQFNENNFGNLMKIGKLLE